MGEGKKKCAMAWTRRRKREGNCKGNAPKEETPNFHRAFFFPRCHTMATLASASRPRGPQGKGRGRRALPLFLSSHSTHPWVCAWRGVRAARFCFSRLPPPPPPRAEPPPPLRVTCNLRWCQRRYPTNNRPGQQASSTPPHAHHAPRTHTYRAAWARMADPFQLSWGPCRSSPRPPPQPGTAQVSPPPYPTVGYFFRAPDDDAPPPLPQPPSPTAAATAPPAAPPAATGGAATKRDPVAAGPRRRQHQLH